MIPLLALSLPQGGQFSRFEWSLLKDLKGHLVAEAEELQAWCLRGDLEARAH